MVSRCFPVAKILGSIPRRLEIFCLFFLFFSFFFLGSFEPFLTLPVPASNADLPLPFTALASQPSHPHISCPHPPPDHDIPSPSPFPSFKFQPIPQVVPSVLFVFHPSLSSLLLLPLISLFLVSFSYLSLNSLPFFPSLILAPFLHYLSPSSFPFLEIMMNGSTPSALLKLVPHPKPGAEVAGSWFNEQEDLAKTEWMPLINSRAASDQQSGCLLGLTQVFQPSPLAFICISFPLPFLSVFLFSLPRQLGLTSKVPAG